MRELLHSEVARVEFAIQDGEPDATPTAGCYAGTTLLGSATVASLGGERNYSATYTLPSSGITPYTVISFRVDAAVDAVDLPTVTLVAGELVTARRNATTPPTAAANATQVRTELATELARIDVATSTRLASASYAAPPSAATNATAVRSELATELARVDATVSSRSTLTATQVWEHATRSLTTFGSLVSDIWSAGTRTLTAISDSSGVTTLLTRIAALLETKAEADARQTALLAQFTEVKGASFDTSTDSLEAIRNRGDAAWITGSGGGAGLTGPYARTIIVTDAADDEPIEGALVRLYRTGETETKATDEDGETVPFATGAYTYSYAVTANGYAGATGTIAISGDGTTTIELTAIVEPVLDNPDHASLRVKCFNEANELEPGAVIYIRIVGIPAGSTGLSFDGISQEATAGGDGIAILTIVKLAKYQIRRGDSKVWKEFTAGSGNSQTMESFIGVDPA